MVREEMNHPKLVVWDRGDTTVKETEESSKKRDVKNLRKDVYVSGPESVLNSLQIYV